MINSKDDLQEYLRADYEASHRPKRRTLTWKYIVMLRKAEYYNNKEVPLLRKFALHRLNRISVKSGICIPINTFGKGLGLFHYGTIIVNGKSHFGENCVIQAGVNIAEGVRGGDYLYFMPGVKVNQNIKIASHSIMASNAVISKDIIEEGLTWGGIPAKIISKHGFYDIYFRDKKC